MAWTLTHVSARYAVVTLEGGGLYDLQAPRELTLTGGGETRSLTARQVVTCLFGLRPEEPAAIRIREAATRGTLSHALLLTGSGDRMSAACFAAAALECTGEESRPCGVCPACRKVLAGIHPDVITVRDPDHKNIAVDVVRAIRADAYIRPNEGRRKVYVFPDCALLTEQDQNVLLKVVE